MATSDCKGDRKMSSSYVQRRERLSVGEELAISATICPSGHQISFLLFFPHLEHTHSQREITPNSILSLDLFQNLWVSG